MDESLTIAADRRELAINAAGEIDALCRLIAKTAPQYEDTMRGIALRAKQLNLVVLNVLLGEEETGELYREVHGEKMSD